VTSDGDFVMDAVSSHGTHPDYGSGSHLLLVGAMVELARRDLADPDLRAEALAFLQGDLVALFAECLGFEGSFSA
jgi:hypothetical protein